MNWSLGDRIDPADLKGVDMLVHCAHDFKRRSFDEAFEVNVIGSLRVIEDAEAAYVRKLVVFSSMAAEPGNESTYGRLKLETEALVAGRATVLRPGLVWDDQHGGLVGAIENLVRRLPLLPVPNIRKQNIAAIHNSDLAEVVLRCQEVVENKVVTVAHPESMSLSQLTSRVVIAAGSKCRVVSVPPNQARLALSALERMGAGGSFRSDSLVSLMTNPPVARLNSAPLGVHVRPFLASQASS